MWEDSHQSLVSELPFFDVRIQGRGVSLRSDPPYMDYIQHVASETQWFFFCGLFFMGWIPQTI